MLKNVAINRTMIPLNNICSYHRQPFCSRVHEWIFLIGSDRWCVYIVQCSDQYARCICPEPCPMEHGKIFHYRLKGNLDHIFIWFSCITPTRVACRLNTCTFPMNGMVRTEHAGGIQSIPLKTPILSCWYQTTTTSVYQRIRAYTVRIPHNSTRIPRVYHAYTTRIPCVYHTDTTNTTRIPRVYHAYTTQLPAYTSVYRAYTVRIPHNSTHIPCIYQSHCIMNLHLFYWILGWAMWLYTCWAFSAWYAHGG